MNHGAARVVGGRWSVVGLVVGLVVTLTGCPGEPVEPEPDAGGVVPDACNTKEEALAGGDCALELGVAKTGYVGAANDEDWFVLTTPQNLSPRGIVQVVGGYAVPATPVSFTMNLLREDGTTSLSRKVDRPGQGAPKPVTLIVPFGTPGAKLLVKVSDEQSNPARPAFDVRATYQLTATVLENPDNNEPNDFVPTAISTAPADAGVVEGAIEGYLATADDVDLYSFNVASANQIAYLRITAPRLSPPPPFRLAYRLLNPAGQPIAEGRVENEFIPVSLATARKVGTGTHTVELSAYRPSGFTDSIPGDLRLKYTVEIRVMPEQDGNEPNDTMDAVRSGGADFSPGAPGGSTTLTGRIGAVADPDWYRIDLPAHAQPTTLRYRLQVGGGGGRFAPIPGPVDRQVRVFTEVDAGTNAVSRRVACQQDSNVCPKGYGVGEPQELLVLDLCGATDLPRCLWSAREEDVSFPQLENFQGAIPVPPSANARTYFVVVQDEGQNWADDRDYGVSFEWRDDADETARFSGGVEQVPVGALPETASYPSPGASPATLQGTLSHGFGRISEHDPLDGDGVRGFEDYDAVPTDVDRFELAMPPVDPDAGTNERAWALSWTVDHPADGGTRPYDLALELSFCDGANPTSDGGCRIVSRASRGAPLVVSHVSGAVVPWYGPSIPEQKAAFSRTSNASQTTVNVDPYGCFCFENRFVRGGKFFVNVIAVDRNHYDETPYEVRMAYAPYPQSYTSPDAGAPRICPGPTTQPDGGVAGGCFFTRQP